MKLGRNQPCPCGSGLKFKKCCLRANLETPRIDPDVARHVMERFGNHLAAEEERKRRFGQVNPIISADFQGQKFVAVGNRLYHDKRWRTFPDFLFSYIKDVLGSGWYDKEFAKPLGERHTIMQWFDHVCEVLKAQDGYGVRDFVPDGTTSAYLLLAYDLYILRHHGKLQKKVMERLRLRDQFRGARYETFVAATFVRAGFNIEYENEADSTTTHPEFIATHKSSRFVVAVEAKARHREAASGTAGGMRPGVKSLLHDAARKTTRNPFVVFVELSLPPEDPFRPPTWIPLVKNELDQVQTELGGQSPFDLVVFTNLPHQYGQPGEPDPARHYYATWRDTSRIPEYITNALGDAASKYGNVPNEFPGDFDRISVA